MSAAQIPAIKTTDTMVIFYKDAARSIIYDMLHFPNWISSDIKECAEEYTYKNGYSPVRDALDKGLAFQIEHGAFLNRWHCTTIAVAKVVLQ